MLKSRRLGSNAQLQKASTNEQPLGRGAKGAGVAQVQDLLADLGFSLPRSVGKKGADGVFGGETEGAVKEFQKRNGLKADGIVGKLTLDALDRFIERNPALEAPSPLSEAAINEFNAAAPVSEKRTVYL